MPDEEHQQPATHALSELLEIMTALRTPGTGCPWDLGQSFDSIVPYTIEEAYEVVDAIQNRDFEALKEELGDLLFQIVFHARMAEEAGWFRFADIVEALCCKMRDRHPHVFAQNETVETAEVQTVRWDAMKQKKRAARRAATIASGKNLSHLDGVGTAFPALIRAQRLQKRAAEVGFDWAEAEPVFAKVTEELEEIRAAKAAGADRATLSQEVGDLLFACVNLARHLKIDAETALRAGCDKFDSRFRKIETELQKAGTPIETCGIDAMEAAWQHAKTSEK